MIKEFKIPSPGESISEVEVSNWMVEDGTFVEKNQELAEVESDKATLILVAEESGIISIQAKVGETVAVGSIAYTIDTDGKNIAGDTSKMKTPVENNGENENPKKNQLNVFQNQTIAKLDRRSFAGNNLAAHL